MTTIANIEPGSDHAESDQERELLRLVRDKSIKKVEVILHDGGVKRIVAQQDVADLTDENLTELVRSLDFQTVSITKHEGKIVRVSREIPISFSKSSHLKQCKPDQVVENQTTNTQSSSANLSSGQTGVLRRSEASYAQHKSVPANTRC